MVLWPHEKSRVEVNPLLGHQGTTAGFDSTGSWSLGRPKGCCSTAGLRRPASRVDRRGLRANPDELEPLDSPGKCPGHRGFTASAETGAPVAVNSRAPQGSSPGPGKVSASPGVKPRAVGRPHAGDLLEAAVGDNPEGATSPVLDAPVGLSSETRQLQLSASPRRRGQPVPTSPKKKLRSLGRRETVVFQDETGFSLHPRLGRGWAKRGQRLHIATTGCHHARLNLSGWVAPLLGRRGMISTVRGNREGFLQGLQHLYRRLRGDAIWLYGYAMVSVLRPPLEASAAFY